MAIAAFQTRVGVGAVGKSVAAFLVAIGTERGDCGRQGGLGMRIMTGLALDAGGGVWTGFPFVGCVLVAFRAQFCIRFYWHILHRMVGLKGAMAGFASYPFLDIRPSGRIIAGGMTFQATGLLMELRPVALEDRG